MYLEISIEKVQRKEMVVIVWRSAEERKDYQLL